MNIRVAIFDAKGFEIGYILVPVEVEYSTADGNVAEVSVKIAGSHPFHAIGRSRIKDES